MRNGLLILLIVATSSHALNPNESYEMSDEEEPLASISGTTPETAQPCAMNGCKPDASYEMSDEDENDEPMSSVPPYYYDYYDNRALPLVIAEPTYLFRKILRRVRLNPVTGEVIRHTAREQVMAEWTGAAGDAYEAVTSASTEPPLRKVPSTRKERIARKFAKEYSRMLAIEEGNFLK